ncbi:MAG: hypothetical protein R3E13_06560 [Alphaproteobacteria bacterium]
MIYKTAKIACRPDDIIDIGEHINIRISTAYDKKHYGREQRFLVGTDLLALRRSKYAKLLKSETSTTEAFQEKAGQQSGLIFDLKTNESLIFLNEKGRIQCKMTFCTWDEDNRIQVNISGQSANNVKLNNKHVPIYIGAPGDHYYAERTPSSPPPSHPVIYSNSYLLRVI